MKTWWRGGAGEFAAPIPEDNCLYFVDHAAQAIVHLIGFLAQRIARAGAVVPSVIAKVRGVQRIRPRQATVKGKTAYVI